ncbi:putative S-adenosyl-L-methionine-dependent methyltransferase [Popillia japonica]|uniref:type II protein arginine methyltransferase n=1 Tax=Popillia japonica TaxID=7064 RepID=A0AAW1N2A6_POPJA
MMLSRRARNIYPILTNYYYTVHQNIDKTQYDLAKSLYAKIKTTGPVTVADYMKEVLTNPLGGYYMHKDMLGETGDFVTSPELSQIFGEMIAIWFLNEWSKVGSPKPFQIVELGPGKGSLCQDILRVFNHFQALKEASVCLVEVSPLLSDIQARKLCVQTVLSKNEDDPVYREGASVAHKIPIKWYRNLKDVPNIFTLLVAHEFFDALPIHKFRKTALGYREVLVDIDQGKDMCFRYVLANNETPALKLFLKQEERREEFDNETPALKLFLKQEERREEFEVSPESLVVIKEIAARLEQDGGLALIGDYGHAGEGTDTFRAFKKHKQQDPLKHKQQDPLVEPGTADLTADVDFQLLKNAAVEDGKVLAFGPVTQRDFLLKMGIEHRMKNLEEVADEEQMKSIKFGFDMMTDSSKMGNRFKFLSLLPSVLEKLLLKMINCVNGSSSGEKEHLLGVNNAKKYGENRETQTSPSQCHETLVRLSILPPSTEKSSPLDDDVFSSSRIQLSTSSDLKKLLNLKDYFLYLKITILVGIWVACCFVMMTKSVKTQDVHQLSVTPRTTKGYLIPSTFEEKTISVTLEGALLPEYYANLSDKWMSVWIQMIIAKERAGNLTTLNPKSVLASKNITETRRIPLVSEKLIGVVPEISVQEYFDIKSTKCDYPKHCYLRINLETNLETNFVQEYFDIKSTKCDYPKHCYLRINLETNLETNFPISLIYDVQPINTDTAVIYAATILVFLYILIIFELVHKTLAAIIASTMSLAVLAALNARPTIGEIISWIDIETLLLLFSMMTLVAIFGETGIFDYLAVVLLLLFSMMTLVAIFGETGIFDYLAVVAYKIAKGRVWTLVNTLCLFTAALSCFLDNVTTALLMTPVTIRLCEMMHLNPVPVLMSMIVYSNIGGAITPIGDPPNVIIASNAAVIKSGVNFSVFTLHMGLGVLFCLIVVYIQFRLMYNVKDLKFDEPNDVQDLKREIEVWKRTAASMASYSKEETVVKNSLIKRTSSLLGKLNRRTSHRSRSGDDHTENLKDLEEQYCIRDKSLLIKSIITMSFVIATFFLHSLPEVANLGLAWTAFLGALLLLILRGKDDIDAIVAKVEWGTLLFFASLFILMEALSKLGLIDWIGTQVNDIIMSVGQESRLAVAILIILWVSAGASAFVDNIPLTTMMIRITTSLAENRALGLPLQPLIWALSFGACLGGNGTLFGSSSNIVCAGVAEQHGYKISFMQFMKIGCPIMLSTTCVVTVYLLVSHVIWTWH